MKKYEISEDSGPTITLFNQDGSSTVYENCKKLPSGGTKTIYELDSGDVIAFIKGNGSLDFLQSEVNFSNHLRELGFRAQNYEIAETEDQYVLKMPSFASLEAKGQQIRDAKNPRSSTGTTYIFGTKENLGSEDHWRKLLTPLIQDISSFYIHGLDFPGDSWNMVVEDTALTKELLSGNASNLITDRGQELHFYFFDFGAQTINPNRFKQTHHMLDRITGKINRELTSSRIDIQMKDKILSLIAHTSPLESEYEEFIRPRQINYKAVFEKIWPEIREQVVNNIAAHLDTLSDEELLNNYTDELGKELILDWRERTQREQELEKIQQEWREQYQRAEQERQEKFQALQEQLQREQQAREQQELDRQEQQRSKSILRSINFYYHFAQIKNKKDELQADSPEFAAAKTLCGRLESNETIFLNSKEPGKNQIFKQSCLEAIAEAKRNLRHLPDWEKFLYQLASAVLSIFSLGIANCATGRGFFELIQPELTHQELDTLSGDFHLLA